MAAIGVLLFSLIMPKRFFHPLYGWFSNLGTIGVGLVFILFLIRPGDPTSRCNGGLISLTALELITMAFIVTWTYVTLDNLLDYTNRPDNIDNAQ